MYLLNALGSYLLYALLVSRVEAQYVIESSSFGFGKAISPNSFAIPGWHILGEGHVPQLLSDKVIVTPPYPGNKRGAIWAENTLSQPEWTANFEFRATGPERGSGNLQLWYAKDGQARIGTASLYTVGRFDGLVLVVDTHGGRGGSIRGFLNDGNTDFKGHHGLDSMAFGHCDYPYRNLGRPSHIQLRQTRDAFEVSVDERPCFSSDKITLPQGYHFGITAASAENPDSFEVFKFLLTTTTSVTREEPHRDPLQGSSQQPVSGDQAEDRPASYYTSQEAQFADLHNRLQVMNHALNNLFREVSSLAGKSEERQQEVLRRVVSGEQMTNIDHRLQQMELTVQAIKKDIEGVDHHGQFSKLHDALRDTHSSLIDHLPQTLTNIVSSSAPRMGFFIFVVIVFQLLLAGSYVIYKRRRANAPKKYL